MSERFYLEMHRRYYTTPSSYLELIKLFLELFDKKQKHASGQRDRIANGLQVFEFPLSTTSLFHNINLKIYYHGIEFSH